MNALTESVIEWIQGERVPQTRFQVIAELRTMASHCNSWPHATVSQWNEAIDAAIKQNLITELDGKLMILAMEPDKPVIQFELF